MSAPERRAPVQAQGSYYLRPGDSRLAGTRPPGSISWEEHEEAWRDYATRFGSGQSAERIAERGGFGFCELTDHLGREPKTWRSEWSRRA